MEECGKLQQSETTVSEPKPSRDLEANASGICKVHTEGGLGVRAHQRVYSLPKAREIGVFYHLPPLVIILFP